MRRKSVLTALMVILMLALVVGNAVAAWQDTKTTQVMAIVPEPDPAGTFRIVSAYCYTYYNYSGEVSGECYARIRNDTDEIMQVARGAVVITTDDTRVEDIEVQTVLPVAVNPRSTSNLAWQYSLQQGTLATYDPVVFNVEVTASGN